jgi:hypothetical protein
LLQNQTYFQEISSRSETVESCLQSSIAEYLNTEVANEAITDLSTALDWVKSTFLYIRASRNPSHYGIPIEAAKSKESFDAWLIDNLIWPNIKLLLDGGMISRSSNKHDTFSASQSGIIMSENYIKLGTMSAICKASSCSSEEQLIWIIAKSEELSSTILRRNEKRVLNKLNASGLTRYIVRDMQAKSPNKPLARIKSPSQKNFLLLMYALSSSCQKQFDPLDYAFKQEINGILSTGLRIAQCMVKYFSSHIDKPRALFESLLLKKTLDQKIWPDDPMLLTQAETIGEVIASRLLSSNINTFRKLLLSDPRALENTAQKNYPWGTKIQDIVSRVCPPPIHVKIKISQQSPHELLDVNINISLQEEGEKFKRSLNRGCILLVYDLKGDVVHIYRKVSYSVFEGAGFPIYMKKKFDVDDKNSLIIKVIDSLIHGHDVHIAVSMTPSESNSTDEDSQRVSPRCIQSKLNMKPKTEKGEQILTEASDSPPKAAQVQYIDLTSTQADHIESAPPGTDSKRVQPQHTIKNISPEDVERFRKRYKSMFDFLSSD